MNSLEVIENNELSLINELDNVKALSNKLMQTKHYQKMGEEGIFAICMTAKSNGIPLMDALNGELYFIQGKVGMSYEAMNKYIRKAGHSVIIKELSESKCTLYGKRKDTGDDATITFTTDDAKRAGKNYDKHPKTMLFARCLSMLKRFLFPDVLTKVYEKGELEDIDLRDDKTINIHALAKEEPRYEVETVEPLLTQEQCEVVDAIFYDCPAFKNVVFKNLSINSIDKIPQKHYQRIIDGAPKYKAVETTHENTKEEDDQKIA